MSPFDGCLAASRDEEIPSGQEARASQSSSRLYTPSDDNGDWNNLLREFGLADDQLEGPLDEHVLNQNLAQLSQKLGRGDVTANPQEDNDQEKSDESDKAWLKVKENEFNFNARAEKGNALAGRWARQLAADASLKERYNACPGRAERANFRAQWARTMYEGT